MPHPENECLRAEMRRDPVRRRRASRAGSTAIAVTAALLAAGSAGAVAQQQAGEPAPRSSSAAKAGGYDVKALQRKLGVTADGVFGPATRRAVKRFQRRSGLKPDGVVGPATLKALGLDGLRATPPTAAGSAKPKPRSKPAAKPSARLQAIARCESGGDPGAVSPDGRYRGKYQFSRATWRAVGGSGDPAAASETEQDRRAAILLRRQGPGAWPNC